MVSKKTMKKLCPDFELHWKEVSTNVRLYGGNEALHLLVIWLFVDIKSKLKHEIVINVVDKT